VTEPDASVLRLLESFEEGRRALGRGLSVEPVRAGVLNRLVRIRAPGVDWGLRLPSPPMALAPGRDAERLAHAAAAAHGFAPALVHADPRSGLWVTEWIDAPTLEAVPRSEAVAARLAERIGALHALAPPAGLPPVDPVMLVDAYLRLPAPAQAPIPRSVVSQRVATLTRAPRRPAVFSHNDLHPGNVLDDRPMRFVDWEYAGCTDPLFELAAVVRYHRFEAPETRALRRAYGGIEADELEWACALFDCVHVLWLDATGGWHTQEASARLALCGRFERTARHPRLVVSASDR
jgi:aminoglycoside phosphotransferase (APT) family kinase protein